MVASAALIASMALPAAALTKNDTTDCKMGSTHAVRGSQSRLVMMTIKIGGTTYYQGAGLYSTLVTTKSGGNKSWSVASTYLNWNDTYVLCKPPY